jgi:hypothetical protein
MFWMNFSFLINLIGLKWQLKEISIHAVAELKYYSTAKTFLRYNFHSLEKLKSDKVYLVFNKSIEQN